jgi:hypothetical protein
MSYLEKAEHLVRNHQIAITPIGDTGYEVDELGNVYGLKGQVLKPHKGTTGYSEYCFYVDGKAKRQLGHRVVAEAKNI